MSEGRKDDEIRLAELLASLSLAIDLGLGMPSEWMMRSALVSARLAKAAGLDTETQAAAYYLALVAFVGCTSTSVADAALFGDELGMGDLMTADMADPSTFMLLAKLVGRGQSPLVKAALMARIVLAMGSGAMLENPLRHCEAGSILAGRMGLGPEVQAALQHVYERWDGKGRPRKVAGDALHPAARVMHVAQVITDYQRVGGLDAAIEVATQRSGTQLEPRLVDVFLGDPETILALHEGTIFEAVLAAEPDEPIILRPDNVDTALEAIADFGDQKVPQILGHSRRVAALADAAARLSGLPAADADRVRRAALLHDVGRVGVQAAILNKSGPLTAGEWERVRLHPYMTERVFAQSPTFGPLAALGALHHERLDGSGYHRGVAAPMLDAPARLLAAANTYVALTEDRPHRAALAPAAAAKRLLDEVKAGRLDQRAVEAVITAAGQKPPQVRRAQAVQLSEREIEVLRLVARQLSNKQIARQLGISDKTVEHHVSHIFDKTGVTTRTGAALYATHHGLL